MQEYELKRAGYSWKSLKEPLQMLWAISPYEICAYNLDGASGGFYERSVIHQERDAALLQRVLNDAQGLVIMIAEAGKHAPPKLPERLKGVPQELWILHRFHGEEVAGEQDEVGILFDGSDTDGP